MNGLLTKLEVKILEFYCLFMDGDEFPCSRALETFQFRFRCVLFSMENGSKNWYFPYDIRSVFTKKLITLSSPFSQRSKFSN